VLSRFRSSSSCTSWHETKTQNINADSDSSQTVEQVTYFKFCYKVSASKVTNDRRRSVTKCKCDASRQSRPLGTTRGVPTVHEGKYHQQLWPYWFYLTALLIKKKLCVVSNTIFAKTNLTCWWTSKLGNYSTRGNSLKSQADSTWLTHIPSLSLLFNLSKLRNITFKALNFARGHCGLLFEMQVCTSWKGVNGIRTMLRCLCQDICTILYSRVSFVVLTNRKTLWNAAISKEFSTKSDQGLGTKDASNSRLPRGLRFTICNCTEISM